MINYRENCARWRLVLCGLTATWLFLMQNGYGANISDIFKAANDNIYTITASGDLENITSIVPPARIDDKKRPNTQGEYTMYYGGVPRLLVKINDKGAFVADWIDDLGNKKTIYECIPGDIFIPLTFVDNGIAFIALSNRNTELVRLVNISCIDGTERVIHTDPKNKVDVLGVLVSGRNNVKLHGVYYVDDGIRYYFFDKEFAEMYKLLKVKLPVGDIVWDSSSDNGRQWIIRLFSDSSPVAYYHFNFDTRELKSLPGKYTTSINNNKMANVSPVEYKSRDGSILHGCLTIPAGQNNKNLPVVVFVHGGPSSRVFRWFDPRVQALASAGYAVFQPNYRGSRGFGKSYMTAGWKTWGTGTLQNDITDGVKYLIDEGIANPGKIAIMGGSFGGYCALSGMVFTPELYACGISIFGMSDLITYLHEVQNEQKLLQPMDKFMCGDVNNPDDLPRLKAQSPINFTDRIRAPLFVYHGTKDTLINYRQSDKLVQLLRERNAEVEYRLIPDADHGFDEPESEAIMYEAILSFLDKHLKNKQQPQRQSRLNSNGSFDNYLNRFPDKTKMYWDLTPLTNIADDSLYGEDNNKYAFSLQPGISKVLIPIPNNSMRY